MKNHVCEQFKTNVIDFHCGVPNVSFEEAGMKRFLLIWADKFFSGDDVLGAILTLYGYSVATPIRETLEVA